jgi:hypothetical protein
LIRKSPIAIHYHTTHPIEYVSLYSDGV